MQEELIKWIEERLEHARKDTLPLYAGMFKSSWVETFGTEQGIPEELCSRLEA